MTTMSRRRWLAGAVAASASWTLGCVAPARTRPRRSSALPDVPGLVALLRESAPGDAIERVGRLIARGLRRDDLVFALQLAPAADVVPRSRFGPDQHSHLVVHSVRLASEAAPAAETWYPLLWAVDFYKLAQARSREYEPEPLAPFPGSRTVAARRAPAELARGMDEWDPDRVEAALVSLWRAGERGRVADLASRHGARDFRHIGHKAIFVANSLAVLGAVGARRPVPGELPGESVVRSIALTLAMHYDQEGRDFDSAWAGNLDRSGAIPNDWQAPGRHAGATADLLAALREVDQHQAGAAFVAALRGGASAQSLWDAVLCSAAELCMNRPDNVIALHAVTTANASYAAFRRCSRDEDRRVILLQAASRAVFYRGYATEHAAEKGEPMTGARIDALAPEPVSGAPGEAADRVLAAPRRDPVATARRALDLLSRPGGERALLARVRAHTARKADDNHDFKLTSAFIEDLAHLSPAWQARYLACCLGAVKGGDDPDAPVTERIARTLGDPA